MDGADRAAVHLYTPGRILFTVYSYRILFTCTIIVCLPQCLLAVLEGKEHDGRLPHEMHDNEAFEDDEGIAESGM